MLRRAGQFKSFGIIFIAAVSAWACGSTKGGAESGSGGTPGSGITGGQSSSSSGGRAMGGASSGGLASVSGGSLGAGGVTSHASGAGGVTADSTAPSGGIAGSTAGAPNGGSGGVATGSGGMGFGGEIFGGRNAVSGGSGGNGGQAPTITDANDFFLPAVNYPLPNDALAVRIADLDGDLAPELIVAAQALASTSTNWSLNVLHNKGNGTFEAGDSYAQPPAFGAFTVGDFNGDNAADIVLGSREAGALQLMQNLGNGKLKAPVDLSLATSSYIASADVNGDHKLDLALFHDSKLAFALNQGSGTFAAPQAITDYANLDGVGWGDLTGDGTADVVVTIHLDQLKVFISNAAGVFAQPISYPSPSMSQRSNLELADLDGDKKADVITFIPGKDSGPGSASVFLNRGDGSLAAGDGYATGAELDNPITAGPPGTGPYSTAAGDLDGDGKADLLFANPGGSHLAGCIGVRLNAGTGKFPTLNKYSVGARPNFILASDLNGDKKADVVFLDQNKLYVRLTK